MSLDVAHASDVASSRPIAPSTSSDVDATVQVRALLCDATSTTLRGTRDWASQTERVRLVDASMACADELFACEEGESDRETFERRLARATRACEDALATANASDVADPFAMLARVGYRARHVSPSSREIDSMDSIESRTSTRGAV